MSTEKSSVALTSFISSLFHNFPKLLLTNLLFAVPSAVFFGIFWFINTITGLNSNFILFLTAIPLNQKKINKSVGPEGQALLW